MKKAVALRYDSQKNGAPKLIAKGKGEVAKRIIEIAGEEGIEIVEDADLVEILASLDLGEEIPQELYEAVAKILAFIYQKKKTFNKEKGVI